MTRTNRIFLNSEGWNQKNETSIQRLEPRATVPTSATSTIRPIITPYSAGFQQSAGSTKIAQTISTTPTAAKTRRPREVEVRVPGTSCVVIPAIAQRPNATTRQAAANTQPSLATNGRSSERVNCAGLRRRDEHLDGIDVLSHLSSVMLEALMSPIVGAFVRSSARRA